MKRVRRVSAKAYHGDVDVTVRLSNTHALTRDEVEGVITDLADSAMQAINDALYFKVPLSKISVN